LLSARFFENYIMGTNSGEYNLEIDNLPDDYFNNRESLMAFFKANEEMLKSLNQVIRKAQKVERDSLARVRDLEAEIKGTHEYVASLEKEIRTIKEHATSKTFSRFIILSEECAKLTKENNIQMYKLNDYEDKNEQLLRTIEKMNLQKGIVLHLTKIDKDRHEIAYLSHELQNPQIDSYQFPKK